MERQPHPANEPNAKGTTKLARLIQQVKVGETIEITRERDRGRAHDYSVDIIE